MHSIDVGMVTYASIQDLRECLAVKDRFTGRL